MARTQGARLAGRVTMERRSPRAHDPGIALYIHIPFCQTKCAYCNFNTYARLGHLVPGYLKALQTEITAWGEHLGHPHVRTIFFGGGTPSWVPAEGLATVLETARDSFSVASDAEISAEANPGDVDAEKMAAWRAMGINRVSMGVQSFDDRLLALLTRRHTADEAVASFRALQSAGFANLNVDLMYGLPHQSMETWRQTLDTALSLGAAHLSLYALTVEEGTPLWKDVKAARVPATDPDAAADMYEAAEDFLGDAGYRHYEISNWALPGRECRHNLVYWHNEPFLGVGPGAHSYLGGARFWDIKSPAEYIRLLSGLPVPNGAIPVVEDRAPVSEEDLLSETLILQLRLDEGANVLDLAGRFGAAALASRIEALRGFCEMGLLEERDGVYRLTRRGRLLSNEVFIRLLPE